MPNTQGFHPARLLDHFTRHGSAVGAFTVTDYEALADNFLGGDRGRDVHECYDGENSLIRYDCLTGEFGVITPTGFIRTYFKRSVSGIAYFHRKCVT